MQEPGFGDFFTDRGMFQVLGLSATRSASGRSIGHYNKGNKQSAGLAEYIYDMLIFTFHFVGFVKDSAKVSHLIT